jgi:hypothetical protein
MARERAPAGPAAATDVSVNAAAARTADAASFVLIALPFVWVARITKRG